MNRSRWQASFAFITFVVLASLDNAAAGVLPPLYAIVAVEFQTDEAALGLVTAVFVGIVAVAATAWGFWGDRRRRRPLLFWGTLLWVGGMIMSGLAASLPALLGWQAVTAVGVGSISAVGFSVVSDYVPHARRGLALSLWSMSQVMGTAGGALLAGTLGAVSWRWPFLAVAAAGFLFALLFLFTGEPARGQTEPDLAPLFAAGRQYAPRISVDQLPQIWNRPTNRWLMLQTFFLALAYGATIWIPRWAIARVEAAGYDLATATVVGNLFVTLFGAGVFVAIPAGHLGDRWQRRRPNGRIWLALLALAGSIPMFVLLYFLPLQGVSLPDTRNVLDLTLAIIANLFRNGWVALTFLVATLAMALLAAEAPNWAATLVDVNLPEHRGTAVGFSRLARALGNGLGVALTGVVLARLPLSPPENYAVGLSLFQLLAVPAVLCYLLALRTVAKDTAAVRRQLRRVAGQPPS